VYSGDDNQQETKTEHESYQQLTLSHEIRIQGFDLSMSFNATRPNYLFLFEASLSYLYK
jgi:hypothetical protein